MKKGLILMMLVSIFYGSQAQIQSSCVIPPLLAQEYKRDIAQLAVNRLFQMQSPDTILVNIPQAYTDTIAEGLAAIFNATSLPERDSVFNLYCVHNLNPFDGFGGYDGFLVKVDTTYSWTNAWQNLNTLTGDPQMDSLLSKYNLSITQFYNWTIGNYAVLSVDSSWNIFALMDSMEMVPGVFMVEQNSYVGVAGKIAYSTSANSRFYDFYFEYADCFDGCDAYRKWKFKVNSDCSVEYLGIDNWCYWDQFGTPGQCPFPSPLNCNTFTPVKEIDDEKVRVLISPNPTSGKFQIEMSGLDLTSPTSLEIYNMQGELISKSSISTLKSHLDLGTVSKGIYLVKIYNRQLFYTGKVVVQ